MAATSLGTDAAQLRDYVIPYKGHSSAWPRIPDTAELTSLLVQACQVAQAFATANPHIDNTATLWRKLSADLQFVQSCSDCPVAQSCSDSPVAQSCGDPPVPPLDTPPPAASSPALQPVNPQHPDDARSSPAASAPPQPADASGVPAAAPSAAAPPPAPQQPPLLTLPRIQGIVNNLQGFWAEWQAASCAPGVTAVSKKFSTVTQVDLALARRKGGNVGVLKRSSVKAEVDVVAHGGHAWIEVKNHESFGTDSSHWLGHKGHIKGLRQQVQELLQVAQAPCNLRRWRPPTLVLYFPTAMDAGMQRELESMGAVVAVGADGLHQLPPPPPPPAVTNLCVTTMCALVSEVSYCDPRDPAMEEWAKGFEHWKECLVAEQQDPLLPALEVFVRDGRPLVACSAAVQQFEELLRMWSGPKERERWERLLHRLRVLPPAADALAAADPDTDPERVLALESIATHSKEVFAAGHIQRAITLTANGNAVRSAANQGVHLETFVHRPVWLAGM